MFRTLHDADGFTALLSIMIHKTSNRGGKDNNRGCSSKSTMLAISLAKLKIFSHIS